MQGQETANRSSAALQALLSAGLVTALAAVPVSAATLKVDDDGVQCRSATFTTIQAAVNAAAPGDKIKVCPGTYAESVSVDKSLKLKGKAPKYKTCNTLATPDPSAHSIIDAPAVPVTGIGFDVTADNVTIQGFVVTHAGEVGIRTAPTFSGFVLKNTILVENANGLYIHSNGAAPSLVKSNCFRRNAPAGIRTRYGLANVTITKNLFFENLIPGGDSAAIIVDQEPPIVNSNLTISRNQSQSDGTFAVVLGTADSAIERNTIDSTDGTAILIGGNNSNLEISDNLVTNAGTRGIRFNTGYFPGTPNTGVLVRGNTVEKAGKHGIAVDSVAGESALVSSTIEKNVVTDSGQDGDGDGIRIEGAAGVNDGNTVSKNTISGSFNHDCHDDTSGTGTAGTGNTWQADTATTQNRANLCTSGGANGTPESPSGAFLD